MAQQQYVGRWKTKITTDTNGVTTIRYHSTAVVQFDDKVVELDTGGRNTQSTKNRMNQASYQFGLGFRVRSRHTFTRKSGESVARDYQLEILLPPNTKYYTKHLEGVKSIAGNWMTMGRRFTFYRKTKGR